MTSICSSSPTGGSMCTKGSRTAPALSGSSNLYSAAVKARELLTAQPLYMLPAACPSQQPVHADHSCSNQCPRQRLSKDSVWKGSASTWEGPTHDPNEILIKMLCWSSGTVSRYHWGQATGLSLASTPPPGGHHLSTTMAWWSCCD
jgi:hypothetical protein